MPTTSLILTTAGPLLAVTLKDRAQQEAQRAGYTLKATQTPLPGGDCLLQLTATGSADALVEFAKFWVDFHRGYEFKLKGTEMSVQVGERVGAILSASDDGVLMFGYGVYRGNHPMPTEGRVPEAGQSLTAETAKLKEVGFLPADFQWTNPKIELDDGTVVWGCECWWGAESSVRNRYANTKKFFVNVDRTPRASWPKEWN